MYNMGFGDCFLLSFTYPRKAKKRHLLIDFGSTSKPVGKKTLSTAEIADDIALESGGKLHGIVATHRHRDHMSGFTTNEKGDGPGDVIRKLAPNVVVQPWTEAPDAPRDATAPRPSSETAFTNGLLSAHAVAEALFHEATTSKRLSARAAKQIAFIGEDNIKNKSAIENLATMAPNEYLHAGMRARGLERAFPGVGFDVLGPATPEQHPDIVKQRATNASEYWFQQARASAATREGGLGFAVAKGGAPPRLRWIMRQMDGARSQQLLGIVRALDSAMNNTSLILLMKVGGTRLLFPGDAQGESWAYVLHGKSAKAAKMRDELAQVNVYKVGHHGSLNATPKTLWNGFKNRSGKALVTAMSTKAGVHGESENTKVPRTTLVKALREESTLSATITKDGKSVNEPYVDIEIDLGRGAK